MDIISQSGEQAESATGFDYSEIPDSEQISVAAERIKECGYRIVEDMIEIGRELIEVKNLLGHGQFQKWIAAEFGWSKQTAINFMHVAKNLGDKSTAIVLLPPTAVYVLAAPSFPDKARQEIVQRLEQGEKFDADQIKRLAKQAKEHVRLVRDQAGLASPKEAPVDAPDTAAVVAPPSGLNGQDDAIPEEDKGAIARYEDPVSRVSDFANIIGELPSPAEVARQIMANGHRSADLPSFHSAADWLRAFCEACETLKEAELRALRPEDMEYPPDYLQRTRSATTE